MPSEQFYIANFTFSIVVAIIGLIFSLIIIVTIATHRQCRTVTNLLVCNTSVWIATFFINILIGSMYGLQEEWAKQQLSCVFQALCYSFSIAGANYSYAVQSISRFFFAVLYKHKYLVTFRVHWYLVALNWIASIFFMSVPLFPGGFYGYAEESRICFTNPRNVSMSMYAAGIGFAIPFSFVIGIYGIIVRRAQQSSRKMSIWAGNATNSNILNAKREVVLVQRIFMLVNVNGCGATLFSILIFWHMIAPMTPPPKELYLLAFNGMALSGSIMIIVMVGMSKQVKDIALRYLGFKPQSINPAR